MPTGYRVTLGDASLDVGDSIGGPLVTFTTATAIGTGNWIWSGTDNGSTFTNASEPGQYFEGTDGFVYFVPDFGPVTTITAASVTAAPAFTVDETVSGSDSNDLIDASFTDSEGDQIGAGADLVRAGEGNDTVLSGEGNDTVYGGGGNDSIDGGSGDDTLYGDTGAPEAAPQNEVLDWAVQGADGTDLAAGFTQDTGTMRVSVGFANNGNNNPTYQVETGETMYVAPGEPFDAGSSLFLFGNGDAATSTTTIGFVAEANSGMSDQVQNVRFRINDIDWGSGNHRDIVTVNAFDVNGNPVSVTITAGAGDTVSGNTITASSNADNPQDATGSALIEIAGPVSEITIVYANGLGGTQGIWLTDLHFTTIPQVAGDDTLDGGDGNDILYGEDGNDTLIGGTGNDTLIGGEGNDTAVFSGPVEDYSFEYGADGSLIVSDSVDGRDGTDTLDEIEFVTFDGTTYRLVQGDDASNTTLQGPDDGIPSLIIAHDGADWGGGHATSDAVFGGAGNDTLDGGGGDDTLVGEGDNDLLRGEGGNDALFGGTGNDTLIGGAGDDALVGGDGDDTAVFSGPVEDYSFDYGADGSLIVSDSMDGRDGTDTLTGIEFVTFDGTTYRLVQGDDTSNTTLQGPNDGIPSLIIAHDGADWGGGHATSDAVFGGAGDDTLDGGDGDDTLVGEGDNDLLRGEGGNDQLFGGDGNDTLEGGDGDDTLFGGTGDDVLSGGSGTNILNGGDGNDIFIGGEGADEFFGGAGMDVIDYSTSSAGVSIDLSTNTASGGDAANDTLSGGIDGIVGSAWNDTLIGFDGQGADYTNIFEGGAGDDFLDGRGGDDFLFGGAGNDTIIGGTGADWLYGGTGDDVIFVGSGDTVFGGEGDDLFIIDESALSGGVITIDGNTGGQTNGDRINFSGLTTKAQITYTNTDPAALAGTATLSDGTVVNFSNMEGVIICFTAGTAILTATGPRPVEDLRPGDMVITRDHGPQPLLWTGQRTVAGMGHFAPIRIETGLFGNTRPLRVSPQHRMLHRSATAALYFDTPEVLLPAKHLINGQTVTQDDCASVTYIHLLFEQHQIIFAEGAASESFHPGKVGLQALSDASREDLFARFPTLRSDPNSYGDTARLCLRQHETRLLHSTCTDIIGADEAKIHAFAAAA